MTEKCFVDTNIVIYTQSDSLEKAIIAKHILADCPVISVQVINEAINVLKRKFKLPNEKVLALAVRWLAITDVEPLTTETIHKAFELSEQYYLSHWDALIVAAALLANCTILYSEDMQHGLKIENSLTILNPFLDKGF